MEQAAGGEIGERARLEREAVLRRPVAAHISPHQDAMIAVRDDEIGGAALRLIGGLVETHGQTESIAEADIGEPGFIEIDVERQVIELGAEAAGRAGDFGGEHLNAKAQFAQERAEEAVQFVAEAAAAAGNDLVEEHVVVEREPPAQVDVQILEWNCIEMREVQVPQCIGRYVERSGICDAFEVSRNIQGVSVAEAALRWVRMKLVILLFSAACALPFAQEVQPPLATFTGTVRQITSTTLTLARPDQDDLDISCTHKTRYHHGTQKIKREKIKPGDRVSVETKLDLYLKPEAVAVRVLGPEKQ